MGKLFRLSLLVLLAYAGTVRASTPKPPSLNDATIAYDVRLHEFRCWREKVLDSAAIKNPCDTAQGWHPMSANLYFVRNQSVSILLINALAADLFALEVKSDDLAEPTVPIEGSFASLPKLLPIPAPPTIVARSGVTLSATVPNVKPSEQIYRRAVTSEEKDFNSWLLTKLIAPLSAKEVSDLQAQNVPGALDQLHNITPSLNASATTLHDSISNIAKPTNTATLVESSRELAARLDDEAALRDRLVAAGVITAGKTVYDASISLRSTPLQLALGIDNNDFSAFVNEFELAFPSGFRYARIAAISLSTKMKFTLDPKYNESGDPVTEMAEFLKKLNSTGTVLTPANLVKLRANLDALADSWADLTASGQRLAEINNIQSIVSDDQKSATGVYQLQKNLNGLVEATIIKAAELNDAERTVALDDDLSVLPIGQWYSSKTITVSLKQGQRVALFDLGGVTDSTRVSVTGGDVPSAKATQPSPADLAVVRSVIFPIYNTYHFRLGFGFVYSTADDKRYQIDNVTTGSGDSATTQTYIDQTRDRDYNLLWTANVIVFPAARHAFPWRPRYLGEKKPAWYTDLAAMGGFSLTSPSQDFVVGGAWFPKPSPVGLQFGWHIGLRDYPPKGFDISQPITDRVTTLQQTEINGFAFGLVFTTDFFTKVFSPLFKQ